LEILSIDNDEQIFSPGAIFVVAHSDEARFFLLLKTLNNIKQIFGFA
jgi:hypothetical protein